MTPFLYGFTDELVKVGGTDPILQAAKLKTKIKGNTEDVLDRIQNGRVKSKGNYLSSAIIGAAITPLAMLGGRGVQRLTSNLMRSSGTKSVKLLSRKNPIATGSEVAGSAAQGGVMGSAYRALLDAAKRKREREQQ